MSYRKTIGVNAIKGELNPARWELWPGGYHVLAFDAYVNDEPVRFRITEAQLRVLVEELDATPLMEALGPYGDPVDELRHRESEAADYDHECIVCGHQFNDDDAEWIGGDGEPVCPECDDD